MCNVQCAYSTTGEATCNAHWWDERWPQLEVWEKGTDQTGSGHVQRWPHVQNAGVHAQPQVFGEKNYKYNF